MRLIPQHARPRNRLLAVVLALGLTLGLLTAGPLPQADAATCPCTVFTATATPANPVDSDTVPIELGLKFRADQDGFVTGVRFYKGTGNSGSHTGSLWDTAGNRLATVTFTGESATGWQQATFASPVAVTANTTYVVSYYAPVGRYASDENYFATQSVVNSPLTALQNGTDGGNGVYRYGSGGGYPSSTYNATNYWVDVVFTTSGADTTKPTVTARTPAAGATAIAVNSGASATFSEAVQSATIAMTLTGTSAVAATTSYDSGTRTVTLTPSANLAASTTYTVNLSGTKDIAGNTMDPVSWTFTTAAASTTACPCTIWPNTATPGTAAANDNSAVELGVKFRANQAGYITGIKFYKGSTNTGTHLGSVWNATGTTKLGAVTFTGESASGWQTATFGSPIPVSANTTYIASYYAPVGRYAVNANFFTAATTNGPLTALQNGTDGGNGVYKYGGSAFPNLTYQASNYWVDVVFNTTAADTVAPSVVSQVPAAGSSGIATTATANAIFSEPISPASSIAMELRGPGNALVPASLSYDAGTQQATLTPTAALATSTGYTVNVSGAKDAAGNTMTPVSWSFTTAAPPPPGPEQGPGGPIAVVTSTSNPYSKFVAEILRTEGLNEFATIDVSTLSASTLASYDVVVLGAVSVTAAQASTLSTWVNGGGNLIALKPSSTLSSLLGITAASGTLTDAYLKVDTTVEPGAGIVADSIQFHGPADKYTADSGTQTVAALWSTATTATSNPAVTLRSVGTNGGQVSAFTYDLARSIALTRQGNIAWAGTERDAMAPIRSDDYFFGGSGTDWVNLSKVAIPQADEQQRLLANLIQLTVRDRKPLPRFWYFPKNYRAVLVGTGDDHASSNGTSGRFDQMIANSSSGCTVADWTCFRYSSYVWNGTPISNSSAATYDSLGFEIGLHPRTTSSDPSTDYTATSINTIYSNQLAAFASAYPSLPSPQTVRMHAIVFSDWSSQPKTEVSNGIRLDTNYYYWPGSWVQDRPGFMTGSGMAMRFTDTDGSLIDNYQAATQMTDESNQSYPSTLNTLVDNAQGAKGFYGSFVTNFHTDAATEPQSDALIAVAQAKGVPIISAKQLLTWLDGRNASSYGNVNWTGNQLSFTVSVGSGANNLTSMLPTAGPNGTTLTGITRAGSAVLYTTSTVKGLEYATFPAGAGNYVATYGGGSGLAVAKVSAKSASSDAVAATQPSQVLPVASANAKTVTWTTRRNSTTQVLLGTSPKALKPAYTFGGATRKHSATLTKLKPGSRYYYRVVSTDTTGAKTVSPAASEEPATFVTAAVDKTTPVLKDAPNVTALPGGSALVNWTTDEPTSSVVRSGGSTTKLTDPVIDGDATTDHSVLLTNLKPGKTYFISTDSQDKAGNKLSTAPLKFVTPGEGVAQTMAPSFRMGETSGSATVDRTGLGHITLGGKLGLAQKGTFVSDPLDAMSMVDWDRAYGKYDIPAGSTMTVSYRVGSTSTPDKTWSDWAPLGDKKRVSGSGRYLQYRVDMAMTAKATAPSLYGIGFSNNGPRLDLPGETTPTR